VEEVTAARLAHVVRRQDSGLAEHADGPQRRECRESGEQAILAPDRNERIASADADANRTRVKHPLRRAYDDTHLREGVHDP
jgi:hypothetical protein